MEALHFQAETPQLLEEVEEQEAIGLLLLDSCLVLDLMQKLHNIKFLLTPHIQFLWGLVVQVVYVPLVEMVVVLEQIVFFLQSLQSVAVVEEQEVSTEPLLSLVVLEEGLAVVDHRLMFLREDLVQLGKANVALAKRALAAVAAEEEVVVLGELFLTRARYLELLAEQEPLVQ